MRIALISPCSLGPDANPGWQMITAGIRALVRDVVANPQFMYVNMLDDTATHWAAAATCDVAILCGNPRFTLSTAAFWETDIWPRLLQLQAGGVRVIDGWSGSAYRIDSGKTFDEMADEIGDFPRNAEWLKYAAAITGRITRDRMMQRIYERAGIASTLCPCSSFFAHHELPFQAPQERDRDAIAIADLHGRPGVGRLLHAIRAQMADTRPVDIIGSTWNDYLWALGEGFDDVQLLCDPPALLGAYRGYVNLLAFRIHAAIPAASVGCAVHVIAIDTRAMTCEPFGLPVTELTDLSNFVPTFECAANVSTSILPVPRGGR